MYACIKRLGMFPAELTARVLQRHHIASLVAALRTHISDGVISLRLVSTPHHEFNHLSQKVSHSFNQLADS